MEKFGEGMHMEGAQNFRGLVGKLIEGNDLFPILTVEDDEHEGGEKMTVLDAIEKNELPLYLKLSGLESSSGGVDAVNCLTALYEESRKLNPDKNFIADTVEMLKGYL